MVARTRGAEEWMRAMICGTTLTHVSIGIMPKAWRRGCETRNTRQDEKAQGNGRAGQGNPARRVTNDHIQSNVKPKTRRKKNNK